MGQSRASISVPGWQRRFDESTLSAGIKLAMERKVVTAEWDAEDCLIAGEVIDGNGDLFFTEIQVDQDSKGWFIADAFCSCEEGAFCSHAVALLVVVAGSDTTPSSASAGDTQGLPREVLAWLESLSHAGMPEPTPLPRKSPDRLLYILSSSPALNGHLPRINCVKCRPKKDGSNGSPSNYTLFNQIHGPAAAFIQPADVRIARMSFALVGPSNGYGQEIALKEPGSQELLASILETGRCHWSSHQGPVLRRGEPRPGRLAWQHQANGFLQAFIEVTPPAAAILPFSPPWYVDPESGLCGPIQTDADPEIARLWMVSPSIDPQFAPDIETSINALSQRQQSVALPKPNSVPVRYLPKAPPVPGLRLSSRQINWWEAPWGYEAAGGSKGVTVYLAEPVFWYGDQVVTSADTEKKIRRFINNELVITERDLEFEETAVARISKTGLFPATDLMHSRPGSNLKGLWMPDKPGPKPWSRFAIQHLPKLRAEGWRIDNDGSLHLDVCDPDEWYLDSIQSEEADWFGIELGVVVDGQSINLLPVLLAGLQSESEEFNLQRLAKLPAKRAVPIILPDGRTLPFPAGRLHTILGTLVELYDPKALDSSQRLKVHRLRAGELAELAEAPRWKWRAEKDLQNLSEKLRRFERLPSVQSPAGLQASLRPYQSDGLRWLQFLAEFGVGGVLADDMGLGKTVQTLAHLLAEKEAGRLTAPCLIVGPTSLLPNWRDEAARFAPQLKVLTLHGSERHDRFEDVQGHDLLLTTYSLLPRDAERLLTLEFHCVVLDEAQNIKNPRTQAAQVVCQLRARHRLCLTGTPLENHLGELWSLFNFLIPGYLGDETRFRTVFRQPIERGGNDDRRALLGRRLKPFLLRRRKDQVALDLPPKTEMVRKAELTGAQRDLYETIRLAMERRIQDEVRKNGLNRSQIVILDALLKLRQVCCDPRLVRLEAARKVTESAKLDLLFDLLPTLLEEGRRILLFSQFTSMLALIEGALNDRSIPYVQLTGETEDRATPVRRFQAGEVPLFLLSLKAGGTGLNLTAADTVILYDPWWNPAVESQATDRAHRIGQDKPVFVYRLLTAGTVEEKIESLQARKRELVRGLLDDGATGTSLQLEKSDLDHLFSPIST